MDVGMKNLKSKIENSKDQFAIKFKNEQESIKKEMMIEINGCKEKVAATDKSVEELKKLITEVKEDQKNVKTSVSAFKVLVKRLHEKLGWSMWLLKVWKKYLKNLGMMITIKRFTSAIM